MGEDKPDIILASGGDGALLHAIQKCGNYEVPFLGIARGTLNFLMNEICEEELENFLNKLENNQVQINSISTTKISVGIRRSFEDRHGKEELRTLSSGKNIEITSKIGEAVNEVAIGTNIMGYHEFLINSKDNSFQNFGFKGSGICVSTDLGSTGYNFNLGGAVLPLGHGLWSIVGIVCNRHINDILGITEITIRNVSQKHGLLSIFLDGVRNETKVGFGDSVVITKGGKVQIAFTNKENFLEKRVDISSRLRREPQLG